MKIKKWTGRICILSAILLAAMLHSANADAAATTIDITPDGNSIKSGDSGENWSYGDVTIPDFGTTRGLILERGDFILTGKNDKCMISIKSYVNRVTLNNCEIQSEDNYPGILMDSTYDMTFNIQGTNKVTTTQSSGHAYSACALFTQNECNYKFIGKGIVGFMATNAIGIYNGNITIDGPEVDVYGEMQGIRTSGRFTMEKGKLYIVTPTSASNSAAIHTYGLTADSSVTINGGYTNIQSGYCCIQSDSFIKITGGTNELTVDTRKEEGFAGIESNSHVEISGGTTIITTPAAQAISCDAVDIDSNALTIEQYNASGTGTDPIVTLSAPVNVKAKNKTYSSCRLSWDTIDNASYYEIQRSVYANGPFEYRGKSSKNTFTDKALTAGTTYYYKVRACVDNSTAGGYSTVVKIKAVPTAPKKIRAVKSRSTLTVKWKKCKKVSGYKVYVSTKPNSGFQCKKTTKKASCKIKIKPGQTYYVKVKSYYRGSTKNITSKFSKTIRK